MSRANISVMGGRTLRTQVALYLDEDKVELLREVSTRIGRTQQELLREAIDDLLARHRAPLRRTPRKHK